MFETNDFVFVGVVGLEPTYRESQYELFVDAGRFYRPAAVTLAISIFQIIENCIGGREFSTGTRF